MKMMDTARRSLSLLWEQKYLWFFGFFVAAGSGGVSGQTSSNTAAAGSTGEVPSWLFAVLAVGLVLGLAFLVMHVVSEAALIEGVRQGERGDRLGIRGGFGEGRRHFWSVLGLKLLFAVTLLTAIAVLVAPGLLAALEILPPVAAALLTIPLVLIGIPGLLTVYFVYEWSLRFIVLEDRTLREALGSARRFLPGRLVESLKATVLAFLGQMGGGLATLVVAVPALLVGALAWWLGGMVAGLVVGGIVLLPLAVVITGATNAFRSSVWTLTFIELRSA